MNDITTCRVDECAERVHVKRAQLCNAHYQQWRTGKPFTPRKVRVPVDRTASCSVDGCRRRIRSLGLCRTHYGMKLRGESLRPISDPTRSPLRCKYPTCQGRAREGGHCLGHGKQIAAGVPLTHLVKRDVTVRDESGSKECCLCLAWKPEGEYTVRTRNPDGLSSECRECSRLKHLTYRFKMTVAEYQAMLESQGNACAICRRTEPGGHNWVIDHDHSCCPGGTKSCGKCVRAILCCRCNWALGYADDSPEVLRRMADYVIGHEVL